MPVLHAVWLPNALLFSHHLDASVAPSFSHWSLRSVPSEDAVLALLMPPSALEWSVHGLKGAMVAPRQASNYLMRDLLFVLFV